ncbi:hypothetical protein [Sinomonas halotolerans]|uniref:Uncharacterized protein n=1 Tax=Sinomonas halotolerans TaxID=1644133 RepID=A0ABU9WVN9_9MICC
MTGHAGRIPAAAGGSRKAEHHRGDYTGSILVTTLLLLAANVWPGWQVLPFLTPATPEVLALVNAAWIAGIVVNLVYLAADRLAVRALGELVTLGIGVAAAFRMWEVFPFDFGGSWFNWDLLVRVLIVVAIVGSFIAMAVAAVRLARAGPGPDRRTR